MRKRKWKWNRKRSSGAAILTFMITNRIATFSRRREQKWKRGSRSAETKKQKQMCGNRRGEAQERKHESGSGSA